MAQFFSASAPLEVLVEVLHFSQAPPDVLAFGLTCHRMWDAWNAGQAGLRVAWKLLQRDIPAAELALITVSSFHIPSSPLIAQQLTLLGKKVRANKLVADEQASGKIPKSSVPLSDLGSGSRLPNAAELEAVRCLHGLVVALEIRFRNSDCMHPRFGQKPEDLPEAAEDMVRWVPGMHRAIYRSFILSASLISVYFELCSAVEASNDPEIQQLGEADWLSDTQEAFLRQFAPYNPKLDAGADHAAFGHVGNWLLESILSDTELRADMEHKFELVNGRGSSCRMRIAENLDPDLLILLADDAEPCPAPRLDGYSHADAHTVALEVIRILWVCGNNSVFDHETPDLDSVVGSYSPLVSWGSSTAETIRYSAQTHLFTPKVYYEEVESCVDDPINIWDLVDGQSRNQIRERSLRMEEQGLYLPSLEYKFFVYFLHHHLQAALLPSLLEEEDGSDNLNNWESFIKDLRIFALDEDEDQATYYPSASAFMDASFLDGTDLLVDSGPLRAQIARLE